MAHTTESQTLYAYVTVANEYCRIPEWLYATMIHKDTITYIIGPWVFLNGFEKTLEGKYLIKIFACYPNKLRGLTKIKVDEYLQLYKYWVRIHTKYVDGITLM